MEHILPNVKRIVLQLAGEIGERSHLDPEKLDRAAGFIEESYKACGGQTERQIFVYHGNPFCNIIMEVKGTGDSGDGILVIGAHYDTAVGTPGADDNASGVAGLLELARLAAERPFKRTVRFVAFTLEEPPAFMTRNMGSHVCARRMKEEGVKVYGMISLEMLGYYCADCQLYPSSFLSLFYPDSGDFISFVGNLASRRFTLAVRNSFRKVSAFPVESLNAPPFIPGVDFSDHRNFWKIGVPAFMITDTAFYRNPNYHSSGDTPETLDYEKMAELILGLYKALRDI